MNVKRGQTTNPPTYVRAVIYCRVSSKDQVNNLSLPTQRKICEEYCHRFGYVVDKVFTEKGESAKTADRTELRKLLSYCRENKGRIQYIVVYSLSRFARDKFSHFTLRATLFGLGITLRSATEPIDDTTTGKLIEGVLAATSQFENDAKSERTKAGMIAAIEDGRWVFSPPLGYRKAFDTRGRRNIEPDPQRAPLVRKAFELAATGLHTKAEVLRTVTDLGLRTTRNAAKLSMQTFQQTLRKPVYAGWIKVAGWGLEPKRGRFEALITEEMFQSVQAVLDGRRLSVTAHVRNHPDFPLRRFVRCATCGTPLTAAWSTGRNERYAYYRCRNAACRSVNIKKCVLESEFIVFLGGLRPKAELMKLFREIVLDVWRQRHADALTTAKLLESKLTRLRARKDQLEEAFIYKESIDEATYRDQKLKLAEDIALAEMEVHDQRLDKLDVEGVLKFAEHVMLNASRIWMEASLDQKQRLQKILFPSGVTYSYEGFGTSEISQIFRFLRSLPARKQKQGSGSADEPFGTAKNVEDSSALAGPSTPDKQEGVPDGI